VVVQETPQPWRQHPGHHRPGRLADLDLPGATRREHDTSALRAHEEILHLLATISHDLRTLADIGYEGESDTITVAFKKPANGELTDLQQQFNIATTAYRAAVYEAVHQLPATPQDNAAERENSTRRRSGRRGEPVRAPSPRQVPHLLR
jgi:hypothetical protein